MTKAQDRKSRDDSPLASKQKTVIELKTPAEIEKMRAAGKIVAEVLKILEAAVRPGVSTKELDQIAASAIKQRKALPAFLNYCGYPAVICASINEEVVHGIPDAARILREGDIVSIDMGVILDGYYGDAAVTVPVGRVKPQAQRLVDVTRQCLEKAVSAAKPGARLGDISSAVQSCAEGGGMSVVREFVGHGIGRRLHEEPPVPNYGEAGTGLVLEPGLVLAVEPMINLGGWQVKVLGDGWTVVTEDLSLSAHFEHTIAVTEKGSEVLTLA